MTPLSRRVVLRHGVIGAGVLAAGGLFPLARAVACTVNCFSGFAASGPTDQSACKNLASEGRVARDTEAFTHLESALQAAARDEARLTVGSDTFRVEMIDSNKQFQESATPC